MTLTGVPVLTDDDRQRIRATLDAERYVITATLAGLMEARAGVSRAQLDAYLVEQRLARHQARVVPAFRGDIIAGCTAHRACREILTPNSTS